MSQGGRVGVQWDLVGQDVQVDLFTEANPVVWPALVLVLYRPPDVYLPDSVEQSTQAARLNKAYSLETFPLKWVAQKMAN